MRRIEGGEKVTGATRFTADGVVSRPLYAKLVLSSHPSARIRNIATERASSISGFVAALASDSLSFKSEAGELVLLAIDRVRYVGQPVVAVLAESAAAAADAAAAVDVDYEVLEHVVDPFDAMRPDAPHVLASGFVHKDGAAPHGGGGTGATASNGAVGNVTAVTTFGWGDVPAVLDGCEAVVRGRYSMAGVHQAFIEPHVVVAAPTASGVTVWSPTQGPFKVREDVAAATGLPIAGVRIVSMPVGGGFGGKIVLLEPLAALLALRSGRAVELLLTRSEEFQVGRPAPASYAEVALGADRDGRFRALDVSMVWDNGASAGWHAAIAAQSLTRGYQFEAFAFKASEVATNKTPVDAYRAPGGTQAYFILESAIDELAERLRVDPVDLRLKNALRTAGELSDGRHPRLGLVECLEAARAHPLYRRSRQMTRGTGEGIGVAVGIWGGNFGAAAAGCRVEPDAGLTIQVGSVDLTGSATSLAMLAAEAFGTSPERVRVQSADTAHSPFAPTAGGSQTLYTVSVAVVAAARDARAQVIAAAAEFLEVAPEDLDLDGDVVRVNGVPGRSVSIAHLATVNPPFQGAGRGRTDHLSPAVTVHICAVKVDRELGEIRVTDYAAIQDVGHAVNPPEIASQIHGGVVQGLGRALGEQLIYDSDGQLRTGTFIDYEMPSIDHATDVDIVLIEVPSSQELGIRGVGEPPAVPGPAALANAVAFATGVRVRDLPIALASLAKS